MTQWSPVMKISRPAEGAQIALLQQHWKNKGWLSADLNFGEVIYSRGRDWAIINNDDRGGGSELFTAEEGDHWAYLTDLPDLPVQEPNG